MAEEVPSDPVEATTEPGVDEPIDAAAAEEIEEDSDGEFFGEDEAEKVMEEEEEEEPSSKRRRRGSGEGADLSRFLDIEAGETGGRGGDDDEDDYELEPDALGEAAEAQELEEDALLAIRRRRERESRMDGMEADEIVKDLEQRYDADAYISDDDVDEAMVEAGDASLQRELKLPTVHDRKLFMVKCRPGHERELVLSLLNKYFDLQGTDRRIHITGAVCNDSLSGVVYVEAQNESQARASVSGLRIAYGGWTATLVPLLEMPSCLNVTHKGVVLKPGVWIRVKRGLFKGDLGKIVHVEPRENKMTVQLIPRIDLTKLPGHPVAAEKEADDNEDDDQNTEKKRRRPQSITERPKQGQFDPEIIKKYGGAVHSGRDSTGELTFKFDGDTYSMGYVYKKMSTKAMDNSVVTPSVDEFTSFQGAKAKLDDTGRSDEDLEDHDVSSVGLDTEHAHKAKFTPGDRVIVVSGALTNLEAIVMSINTDYDEIVVQPQHPELKEPLTFTPNQLRKHFKVGVHVKVVHGRHEGETGLVLKVIDDCVVVFTDLGMDELKVLTDHVQETAEVSSGLDSAGNYAVGDLVQIDGMRVGMVVRVDKDVFQLLDSDGKMMSNKLSAMGRKRGTKWAQGLDMNSRTLSVGDPVTIEMDGGGERDGTIKALFRNNAWIHSKDQIDNAGYVSVPTRKLRSKQVTPNEQFYEPASATSVPYSPMSHPAGVGGGMAGNTKAFYNRMIARRPMRKKLGPSTDDLVGRDVTVPSGPWKGYHGVIKEINEPYCRVELHTNGTLVSIEKSRVEAGTQPLMAVGITDSTGSGDYSMGPPATPGNYFSDTRTPLWGDTTTPMRDPGTPGRMAWDPNALATPAPDYSSEDRDAWDAAAPTPAPASYTPYDQTAQYRQPEEGQPWQYDSVVVPPEGPYAAAPAPPIEEPWQDIDIVVVVDGQEGVIKSVNPDQTCDVYILDTQQTLTNIQPDKMVRANISKKDRVKVVLGSDNHGQLGFVLSVEGGDGVVNFGGKTIKILPIDVLARVMPGVGGSGVVLM